MSFYVYGITRSEMINSPEIMGLQDRPVSLIESEKLSAIVSETDLEEVDPLRRHVKAHTRVQEKLLESSFLLPLSFGTIAEDPARVEDVLQQNEEGLCREVDRLKGTVQLHLKIQWNRDAMTETLQEDSAFENFQDELESPSSAEQAQQVQLEAGQYIKETADQWKNEYVHPLLNELQGHSEELQEQDPADIQTLEKVSILLRKDDSDEVRELIHQYDEKYEGKLDFKLVGPLAPYDFVEVEVSWAV